MGFRQHVRLLLFVLVASSFIAGARAEPEIQRIIAASEGPTLGQAGGPVLILASGLVSPAAVFFSDGLTPSLPATPVVLDLTRGALAVRIPAGALTGMIKVRANGVDSALYYFRIQAGTFTQGDKTVSGLVTNGGAGVSGATVLLIKDTGCDNSPIWDYAVTDSNGSYTLRGATGPHVLFVLPPVSSGRAGSAAQVVLTDTPATQDFALTAGTLVTGRVVDANSPATPEPRSRIEFDNGGFETALADGSGNFSVRLAPDMYTMTVTPPAFFPCSWLRTDVTIGAPSPQALGNAGLPTGVKISGLVTRAYDGRVLPGAEIDAQVSGGAGGGGSTDRRRVLGNGAYSLVVPPNHTYRLQARFVDDAGLLDVVYENFVVGSSNVARNITGQDAAVIAGTVVDRTGGTPLANLGVQADRSVSGGPPAASGRTCQDGSYRLRVLPDSAGYFVTAGTYQNGSYARVTHDATQNGTFFPCEGVRVDASTAGVTTPVIDFRLPQGVSISGKLSTQTGGCTDRFDTPVTIDDGSDHACGAGLSDSTLPTGNFSTYALPPSTVVASLRACVRQPGYDAQCWNLIGASGLLPGPGFGRQRSVHAAHPEREGLQAHLVLEADQAGLEEEDHGLGPSWDNPLLACPRQADEEIPHADRERGP